MSSDRRPRRRNAPRRPARPENEIRIRLYGRHPVAAALANPARRIHRLWASRNALATLESQGIALGDVPVETVDPAKLSELSPPNAPHQGLVLEADPLQPPALAASGLEAPGPGLVLLLDQVEDPQNVGAILRTAAAFGARALITQTRRSPAESGALAKAASGALDIVPWIRATNLADALERLAEQEYWRLALASEAEVRLDSVDMGSRLVLALGSEGKGLRPRVRAHCDLLAHIPLKPASPLIDSLNVSAAAAAALYAVTARRGEG